MKKTSKIITGIGAGLIAFAGKAAAEGVDVTPWYPQNDHYTQYWFNWGNETFAPYSFLESVTLPFTDAIGYWFFVILWGAYLFGVWNRAMSLEIIVVTMLILCPLWGALLPPESYPIGMICLAIGLAAIAFKLFKK